MRLAAEGADDLGEWHERKKKPAAAQQPSPPLPGATLPPDSLKALVGRTKLPQANEGKQRGEDLVRHISKKAGGTSTARSPQSTRARRESGRLSWMRTRASTLTSKSCAFPAGSRRTCTRSVAGAMPRSTASRTRTGLIRRGSIGRREVARAPGQCYPRVRRSSSSLPALMAAGSQSAARCFCRSIRFTVVGSCIALALDLRFFLRPHVVQVLRDSPPARSLSVGRPFLYI